MNQHNPETEAKEHSNSALTPNSDGKLTITSIKKNSAGIPAIASAMGMVSKYMDPSDAAKVMFRLNQKGGIDCPGCAWPDPDDERSSLGEYCENGIKAIAEEAQSKTIGASFFRENSIVELGARSDFELGKSGRLAEPLIIRKGSQHYEPINWNDAFEIIGEHLNALHSPDEAIFYTSGRTSNEAAFMYQLFVREYGTNNLPDCSNMCHESSGKALMETLGIGKGSITLEDIEQAELVLVVGQNPGTNHPRMLSTLEKCKWNGGRIISINPLPEAGLNRFTNPQSFRSMLSNGTPLADLHLPVRINSDVALFKAIFKLLLEKEKEASGSVFDRTFIEDKTSGYDAFCYDLSTYELDELINQTGVDPAMIKAAAEMIAPAKKIIICWAMGLTQHENGVDNVREMVNLLLLKGAIGIPGAGVCPVRGHSNVQGDRTMGIWEEPNDDFLDRLDITYGIQTPRHHGYSVVDAIKAMDKGKGKVFIAMGGNFLSATPDTTVTARGLSNCDLTVHVSTKLNRSHLVPGKIGLILPCLGRTELDMQEGSEQILTMENSMGVVHSSKGVLPPCSELLLSEPAIIAGMAKATLGRSTKVPWEKWVSNYDLIRDDIEKVIPGFDQFNVRVRQPGGFYLPNPVKKQEFNTSTGKAQFSVNRFPTWNLQKNEYLMMTIRSHDQFNTTIYGMKDRYRGISGGRWIVMMNESDMVQRGWKDHTEVMITSHFSGKTRTAGPFRVVSYPIPKSCVATYFPEANVLIPLEAQAHTSKTPASKSVVVTLDTLD